VLTNTTGLAEQQGPVWWAYGISLTAALSAALGAVYARRNLEGIDPTVAATGLVIGGLVMTLPFLLIPGSFALAAVTPGEWGATFLSGFLSAGLGYLIFLIIIQKHGATIATFTGYIITIAAALLGAWLLREQITGPFIIGAVLILGGVYLVSR
jgi:drug/metabolite transporter (DMT)-like permease